MTRPNAPFASLRGWLDRFLAAPRFESVMSKYPQWQPDDAPVSFP